MRKGTAPGPDSNTVDPLKDADEAIIFKLANFLTQRIEKGKIPEK